MKKSKRVKKFIFVVGGVMSSVGKGVAAASLGKILKSKGYRVANIKCDMYVNVDAGTIRPAEHGEVFVGYDGIEADQDLGNYERFTDQTCTRDNYITTGQVYQEVIRKERNLEYEGEDVEVYPDVPNEIIDRIKNCQRKNRSEVTIIEFGGTIGEYQLLLFLEAARMMKARDPENVFFVMVSYLPTPNLLGEQKSKPTQYAIRTLNSAGISPDFIICRAKRAVSDNIKKTISVVCSLEKEKIISAPDISSIYDIPVNFEKENLGNVLLNTMGLKARKTNMQDWIALSKKIKKLKRNIKIGIVGKYFNSKSRRDTYISVIESINHSAWFHNFHPEIVWLDSEVYEKNPKKLSELSKYDGIIVPGGFGSRGVEGIIKAIEYVRENKIPYLGLCYGMQLMVIEFARNVVGLKNAHTVEINSKTKYPVIDLMPEQKKNMRDSNYGATMRLGNYPCRIKSGTLAQRAYKRTSVNERHRHRYEVNPKFIKRLVEKGIVFSGISPDRRLMEIAELPSKQHPFMVGSQFHPEFTTRPLKPNPLFREFMKEAINRKQKK